MEGFFFPASPEGRQPRLSAELAAVPRRVPDTSSPGRFPSPAALQYQISRCTTTGDERLMVL